MKKLTVFLLLLIFSEITCLGQVNGFEFTPNHLKGYKKIVTISVLQSTSVDSLQSRTYYYIDSLGRITLIESFEKGEKVHMEKHTYNTKGQLSAVENHNQVYSYDEKVKDHVPVVKEDTYFLTSKEYKNSLLIKEMEYTYFMGTGSLNGVRQYEYDRQRRKTKETYTNLYEGLTVAFESNTDVIDSIYYKGEAERTTTTFSYSKILMLEKHLDEKGQISNHSYLTLNSKMMPLEVMYTDKDGSEIERIIYEYNNEGYLTHKRRHAVDSSKLKGDILAEDDYRIMYGKNKLPAEVITYYKGQVISRLLLTYQ